MSEARSAGIDPLTDEEVNAIVLAALDGTALTEEEIHFVLDEACAAKVIWITWQLVLEGHLKPVIIDGEIGFARPEKKEEAIPT